MAGGPLGLSQAVNAFIWNYSTNRQGADGTKNIYKIATRYQIMRGMLAAIAVAFSLLMLYGCTGCNLFNPEENGHQNGSIHPFNPEETGYQNGSLHGKLTDSESAPLSDVTISFKGAKSSFSVSAGDSGSYDITDIPPDTYSVEYSKDGYYIYGYSGFTVADGQAYQKDVVLKGLNQYGELHGTVYDSKGTPLANVTVLFVGKKSNFSTVISQNSQSYGHPREY